MTTVFYLYGLSEKDISKAVKVLSQALGLSFQQHDSEFRGDYYLALRNSRKEKYRLMENFISEENAWHRPEFQKYPILFEIAFPPLESSQEIEASITRAMGSQATILQRKVYQE